MNVLGDCLAEEDGVFVYQQGQYRYLTFSDKNVQTSCLIKRPYELTANLQRSMVLSFDKDIDKEILMLGLGGGALLKYILHLSPKATVTVVEINQTVVKLARRYFYIDDYPYQLKLMDAKDFLETAKPEYSFMIVDVFSSKPKDNLHTTCDLIDKVFHALSPEGAACFNVACYSKEDIESILKKMMKTFNKVIALPIDNKQNLIIHAYKDKVRFNQQLKDKRLQVTKTSNSYGVIAKLTQP